MLNQARFVDQPADFASREVEEFLALNLLALGFAYDEDDEEPDLPAHAALVPALRRAFLQFLYVDRTESADIAHTLSHRPRLPILAIGTVGVGKTSILLKSCSDLRATSSTSGHIHYLDVKKHADRLAPEGVTEVLAMRALSDILCTLVYDAEVVERNLLEPFALFQLKSHSHFRSFYRGLLQTLRIAHEQTDDAAILRRIRSDGCAQDYASCCRTLDWSSDESLTVVLRFVRRQAGELILAIDNIDRYPLPLQERILMKAVDLSEAARIVPLVAIRTANFRLICAEGRHAYPVVHQLIGTRPDESVRLQRALRKSPKRNITTTLDVVRKFVHTRLEFVLGFVRDSPVGTAFGDKLAIELDVADHAAFVEQMQILYHRLETKYSFVLRFFGMWNNSNLRGVASDCFGFLSLLMRGRSGPLSCQAWEELLSDTPNHRHVRSLTYRYLLLGDAPTYTPGLHATNVFDSLVADSPADAADLSPLAFLPLKVILYCNNKRHVAYGRLVSDFARVGVAHAAVFEALAPFVADPDARGPEAGTSRCLHVHAHPRDIGPDMPYGTAIELESAGEFFAQSLVTSCEYLFWCAMNLPAERIPLVQLGTPYAQVQSETYRLAAVLEFLTKYVWPLERTELERLSSQLGYTTYIRCYGIDGEPWLLCAARSLRTFLKDLTGTEAEKLRASLANLVLWLTDCSAAASTLKSSSAPARNDHEAQVGSTIAG